MDFKIKKTDYLLLLLSCIALIIALIALFKES